MNEDSAMMFSGTAYYVQMVIAANESTNSSLRHGAPALI
jgi:hypothetical protein